MDTHSFAVCISLLVFLCGNTIAGDISISWEPGTKQFSLHFYANNESVVEAHFQDEINNTGWAFLEIKSHENYSDSIQAYAAGWAEGYLTHDLLKKHWYNIAESYCENESDYCKRLEDFLNQNQQYINSQISKYRNTSTYWHQAALVLEQLSGIEDGFRNTFKAPRTKLNVMGLTLLNAMGDLEDLEAVLNKTTKKRLLGEGSCSSLIKVLPEYKDLYFAHVSWTSYDTMLRILKKYDLAVHEKNLKGSLIIAGRQMTFSSQPGLLGSGDDFYLISSGLATMETTIGNGNSSLWSYVKPRGTLLEWQRSIIANRLSKNGSQWTNIFSQYNSGTYNNQWMIVDYSKFSSGNPLQDGLLWVLEQLPGYIHKEDVTEVLRRQSYWPSYNTPYFQDIFNLSGSQANVEKFGDWFTYNGTPRALIFKRDDYKVHDISSMMKLMRYNNFTKDPLSRCNCTPPYSAENAISARCDLNPINGTYPFPALGHRPHGSTDMKMTSAELFKSLQFIAIGGPTHDPLPPFQWSTSDYDKVLRHEGHPDLWDFKPVLTKWKL